MSRIQFSVVVPTYQRRDLLARCLESLRPGVQTAEGDSYEVIVTDDSRDGVGETLARTEFAWARWVQGPSRGPAANRNNGARHAVGEWICFIDDDCIADEEWLAAMREASTDSSIQLLEGRTAVPDMSDNPFLHVVFNRDGGVYWSCNLAIRREQFIALGGFDEDFMEAASEDMEFAQRFHAHGNRSRFCPAALVFHPVRNIGWRGVWKRLFLVRWEVLYHFKIDKDLHLSDSATANMARAVKDSILSVLRLSRVDLRGWKDSYWRIRWFSFLIRWLTFPIVLPYYLYWVKRYHKELNARRLGAGS